VSRTFVPYYRLYFSTIFCCVAQMFEPRGNTGNTAVVHVWVVTDWYDCAPV